MEPAAADECNSGMAHLPSSGRMSRFRPIGVAWRTYARPKHKWQLRIKPIYLVGFAALVSFVAVVLSCSGSLS
jgi:hypothetical protein